MSLINQMLQDLDARRSDISPGGHFGQQIRAVHERRRFHPAWWVALALGGMLIGLIGYVVLRPADSGSHGIGAQLPLKLEIGLNAGLATQHGGPISAPTEANSVPPNSVPPEQTPIEPVTVAAPAAVPTNEPVVAQRKPRSLNASSDGRQATVLVREPVPPLAEVVPPAKVLVTAPVVKSSETAVQTIINKQFKELTPAQRAENEYRKAVFALQQGKRAEAAGGFEQALQIDPKHPGARQALIGVLLDAKQQDEAVQKGREGLSADPAQPGLAMILARLQLEKGELRAAIETLERTLPHASEKADYLAFLAALLQRDERHKQAVEHYLLALQKAPQNGVWWMGLGISLQAVGRAPEAQESFRRAKATNSLSPELLSFVEARIHQLQR